MNEVRILLPGGLWEIVRIGDSADSLAGREGTTLVAHDNRLRIKCFDRNGANLERKQRKTLLMVSEKYDALRKMIGSRGPDHFGGFTWPIFTAYDMAGDYIGYGMVNLTGTRPLDHYHSDTNPESLAADLKDRLQICTTLSVLFHLAHEAGLCIGDARPANVHVKRAPDGHWLVYVIDTDSFQLADAGVILTSDIGADDHSSPRLLERARLNNPPGYLWLKRSSEDDVHALAVICFQTLLSGHHPFQTAGTKRTIADNLAERVFAYSDGSLYRTRKHAPLAEYRALPPALRARFEAAFLRGDYGSAASWAKLFQRVESAVPERGPASVPKPVPKPRPARPFKPASKLSDHLHPVPRIPVSGKMASIFLAIVVAVLIAIVIIGILAKR